MALFIRKTKADILREALRKLESSSPISSTSPGSVARSFTEAITTQLADYYDALDFQTAQSVISTASGRSLDLLGELYGVKRRTVSDLIATDAKLGAFYFYIDSIYGQDIIIPRGTQVFTSANSFVGQQLSYSTASEVIIPVGETRAFASLVPNFSDALYTAAPNTLVSNSLVSPPGTIIRSVNPKAIPAQPGYENDENYRIRIIKSIRVNAAGTPDAVRYAILGVQGVRDVKLLENVYGFGSFQLIVTPEVAQLSTVVTQEMIAAVNNVRPVGVRMFLSTPILRPMDINMSIIIKAGSRLNSEVLANRVSIAVKRYLNSLFVGDTLVYNKLVQYALDVSADVLDVQVTKYAPNGVESLRRNFTPKPDELLIPGEIRISTASQ